jgi:hypothetical protein
MDEKPELLNAILEIRDLVRLMAEPAIAERDQKLRNELKRIVGNSRAKQKSVFFMDGNHSQSDIRRTTNVNQGDLSTLVKRLKESKLLKGDSKKPELAISIPSNFF